MVFKEAHNLGGRMNFPKQLRLLLHKVGGQGVCHREPTHIDFPVSISGFLRPARGLFQLVRHSVLEAGIPFDCGFLPFCVTAIAKPSKQNPECSDGNRF